MADDEKFLNPNYNCRTMSTAVARKVRQACRLSPNEEAALLREKHEERRRARILQVREQEKGFARRMSDDVRSKREAERQALQEHVDAALAASHEDELRELEEKYMSRMGQMGLGHKDALRNNEEENRLQELRLLLHAEQRWRAQDRHKAAMKEVTSNQLREKEKDERKIDSRKRAFAAEKIRAQQVAAKPKSSGQTIIMDFTVSKGRRVQFKEADDFASTYYHIPHTVVQRIPTPDRNEHNACEMARERAEADSRQQKQSAIAREEQEEKARLRHKHAMAKVKLDKEQVDILSQLKTLEREDRTQRQKALAKMPANVFQPTHRRVELVHEQQRDMEQTFEKLFVRTHGVNTRQKLSQIATHTDESNIDDHSSQDLENPPTNKHSKRHHVSFKDQEKSEEERSLSESPLPPKHDASNVLHQKHPPPTVHITIPHVSLSTTTDSSFSDVLPPPEDPLPTAHMPATAATSARHRHVSLHDESTYTSSTLSSLDDQSTTAHTKYVPGPVSRQQPTYPPLITRAPAVISDDQGPGRRLPSGLQSTNLHVAHTDQQTRAGAISTHTQTNPITYKPPRIVTPLPQQPDLSMSDLDSTNYVSRDVMSTTATTADSSKASFGVSGSQNFHRVGRPAHTDPGSVHQAAAMKAPPTCMRKGTSDGMQKLVSMIHTQHQAWNKRLEARSNQSSSLDDTSATSSTHMQPSTVPQHLRPNNDTPPHSVAAVSSSKYMGPPITAGIGSSQYQTTNKFTSQSHTQEISYSSKSSGTTPYNSLSIHTLSTRDSTPSLGEASKDISTSPDMHGPAILHSPDSSTSGGSVYTPEPLSITQYNTTTEASTTIVPTAENHQSHRNEGQQPRHLGTSQVQTRNYTDEMITRLTIDGRDMPLRDPAPPHTNTDPQSAPPYVVNENISLKAVGNTEPVLQTNGQSSRISVITASVVPDNQLHSQATLSGSNVSHPYKPSDVRTALGTSPLVTSTKQYVHQPQPPDLSNQPTSSLHQLSSELSPMAHGQASMTSKQPTDYNKYSTASSLSYDMTGNTHPVSQQVPSSVPNAVLKPLTPISYGSTTVRRPEATSTYSYATTSVPPLYTYTPPTTELTYSQHKSLAQQTAAPTGLAVQEQRFPLDSYTPTSLRSPGQELTYSQQKASLVQQTAPTGLAVQGFPLDSYTPTAVHYPGQSLTLPDAQITTQNKDLENNSYAPNFDITLTSEDTPQNDRQFYMSDGGPVAAECSVDIANGSSSFKISTEAKLVEDNEDSIHQFVKLPEVSFHSPHFQKQNQQQNVEQMKQQHFSRTHVGVPSAQHEQVSIVPTKEQLSMVTLDDSSHSVAMQRYQFETPPRIKSQCSLLDYSPIHESELVTPSPPSKPQTQTVGSEQHSLSPSIEHHSSGMPVHNIADEISSSAEETVDETEYENSQRSPSNFEQQAHVPDLSLQSQDESVYFLPVTKLKQSELIQHDQGGSHSRYPYEMVGDSSMLKPTGEENQVTQDSKSFQLHQETSNKEVPVMELSSSSSSLTKNIAVTIQQSPHNLQETFLKKKEEFVRRSQNRLQKIKADAAERKQNVHKFPSTTCSKHPSAVLHSTPKGSTHKASQPLKASIAHQLSSQGSVSQVGSGSWVKDRPNYESRKRAVTFSSPLLQEQDTGMFSPPDLKTGVPSTRGPAISTTTNKFPAASDSTNTHTPILSSQHREKIKRLEMKERNTRFYNKLPEVKEKHEEEKKAQRDADNREKAKQYQQKISIKMKNKLAVKPVPSMQPKTKNRVITHNRKPFL